MLQFRFSVLASALSLAFSAPHANFQTPPESEQELAPLEVASQRTKSDLMRPTRQVNVIEHEELNELRQGSDSFATLLSKIIPGMADSSHTISDFGQTLRGRNMLVLVDGSRSTSIGVLRGIWPASILPVLSKSKFCGAAAPSTAAARPAALST